MLGNNNVDHMSEDILNNIHGQIKISVEPILQMLKRIFGTKWDEVTGGWRTLHNEELHNCSRCQV
jgi:hypothetical protein